MASRFSCDYGLYWIPGAGGNFLAGLLFPDRIKQKSSNEFNTDHNFWASFDRFDLSVEGLDSFIKNNPSYYPILGFHSLPLDHIISNRLSQYIGKKHFFVVDCNPSDVEFCLALNFAKKWVYAALKDRHFAFETIASLATNWSWSESSMERNYERWKSLFDESEDLEREVLGHYLNQYFPGWSSEDHWGKGFQYPVTNGHLLYVARCVREGVVRPDKDHFIKTIKEEFNIHPHFQAYSTDNIKIDDDGLDLTVVRMPYSEIFFQANFPYNFIKHVKNFDPEVIKAYSLKNLELVESFVKNLYISKGFRNYLDRARNHLTNTTN
jgi:hypothetical protein